MAMTAGFSCDSRKVKISPRVFSGWLICPSSRENSTSPVLGFNLNAGRMDRSAEKKSFRIFL